MSGIVTRARRAPKKYADKERTKITPEWRAWREEQNTITGDDYTDALAWGFTPSVYFPEEDGKRIPEEGAWILVLEEPLTELRERFRVPLLSMWRARPHQLNSGAFRTAGGRKVYPQQAVISTPGGDLHLWAHEYIIASNPMGLVGDPDATLQYLGGAPVLDADQMFYLQSRGISHHDAVMLLFEQITQPDFVYVTFPEEITEMLRGVGTSLASHVANNPRPRIDYTDEEMEDE